MGKTEPIFQNIDDFLANKCDEVDPPSNLGLTTSCRIYKGRKRESGYVRFNYCGKTWFAHRLVYTVVIGPFPDALQVQHLCNNPSCCEPTHLILGTHLDNMKYRNLCNRQANGSRNGRHTHPERTARGDRSGARKHPERLARGLCSGSHTKPESRARGHRNGKYTRPESTPKGESHVFAKLNDEQVREIRRLYSAGVRKSDLARTFNVSYSCINSIIEERSWKHLLKGSDACTI